MSQLYASSGWTNGAGSSPAHSAPEALGPLPEGFGASCSISVSIAEWRFELNLRQQRSPGIAFLLSDYVSFCPGFLWCHHLQFKFL